MNIQMKLDLAKETNLLHLAQSKLRYVPSDLFRFNFTSLYRLDLGFNLIQTLPDAIGQLTSLECLWINDNPLTVLPPSIYKCTKLRVLDLNRTSLSDLPCEMGRLENLKILDMDEVPLHSKLHAASALEHGEECKNTLAYLRRKDIRRQLKQELLDKLKDGPYLECSDTNDGQDKIKFLLKAVLRNFKMEEDVRSLLRNAERLFPADINKAYDPKAALGVRTIYDDLKRDNEKKKLGAELELKIRNIYFDRIDPSIVEPMVTSIYTDVKALKDIKFLIRHATELFPPTAAEVNGVDLKAKLVSLQEDMARERALAVEKVLQAVTTIYSDVEPEKIKALIALVTPLFKNVKDLKTLAADAGFHFPGEFLHASAQEIRASFLRKSQSVNETSLSSNSPSM